MGERSRDERGDNRRDKKQSLRVARLLRKMRFTTTGNALQAPLAPTGQKEGGKSLVDVAMPLQSANAAIPIPPAATPATSASAVDRGPKQPPCKKRVLPGFVLPAPSEALISGEKSKHASSTHARTAGQPMTTCEEPKFERGGNSENDDGDSSEGSNDGGEESLGHERHMEQLDQWLRYTWCNLANVNSLNSF